MIVFTRKFTAKHSFQLASLTCTCSGRPSLLSLAFILFHSEMPTHDRRTNAPIADKIRRLINLSYAFEARMSSWTRCQTSTGRLLKKLFSRLFRDPPALDLVGQYVELLFLFGCPHRRFSQRFLFYLVFSPVSSAKGCIDLAFKRKNPDSQSIPPEPARGCCSDF